MSTTPDTAPGLTRREFLKKLAYISAVGFGLPTGWGIASFFGGDQSSLPQCQHLEDKPQFPRSFGTTPIDIEFNGTGFTIEKASELLPYTVQDKKGCAATLWASFRAGAVDFGVVDGVYRFREPVLLTQTDSLRPSWTDAQAGATARALLAARQVNMAFFAYDNFGPREQIRRPGRLYINKGIPRGLQMRHLNDESQFVTAESADILYVNSRVVDISGVLPSESLLGNIAMAYNQHLNHLTDLLITSGNSGVNVTEVLREGMAEYAYFLATGKWRTTTPYGLVVAEGEKKFPGVWAHANMQTALYAASERGLVPLGTYLKFGDEKSGGASFSDWFEGQPVFSTKRS